MKKTFVILALILVAAANSSFALPISGVGALGSFEGVFTYSSGLVTVSLTNTSPAANGGFLTGFLFNVPSEFTINGFSASGANFSVVNETTNNGAPFGTFNLGAAVGGNWEGGGIPQDGIAVGASGIFTFNLSVSGNLTEANFFSQASPWFVARFRGFANGGSDKVPGGGGTPVPEPATLLLLGAGLAGIAAFGRRKLLS